MVAFLKLIFFRHLNKKIYFKISPAVPAFHDAQARLCLSRAVGQGLPPGQPRRTSRDGGKLSHGVTPSCWYRARGNLFHHQGATVTPGWRQSGFLSAALRCWLLLMLSVTWLAACGETVLPPEDVVGPRTRLVHVTSNGWHTAIVVPAPALVAIGVLPEVADFSDAAFLEFGWGDRIYYQAKETTFDMALIAALVPTPAVMHMAALQAPPEDDGSGLKVISVKLTESGFQRLAQALAAEFERPPGGRAESVSRGLYSNSHFYHARGEFHLFNTCNTWTARMLLVGGVAFSPSGIMTADELMTCLREALAVE